LNKLQQPIVPVVLSKMGYCSNTSRILTFLCSFNGGIDFRDLRLEQGIGQITFLICHLSTPGQVYDLLNILLSWFQLCAGIGYPIFIQPERQLPHLEGYWLASIRNFLAHIDGALELTKTHIQPLQRTSNLFLMDKACNSGLFTPAASACTFSSCLMLLTHPNIFGQARANPGTNSYSDENFYLARLPITRQQILAGTTMMRSTCQSKCLRQTESKEEAS
jgi:hypothetical protein